MTEAELLAPILGTRDLAETAAAAIALVCQWTQHSETPADDTDDANEADDMPDCLRDLIPDGCDPIGLHDEAVLA